MLAKYWRCFERNAPVDAVGARLHSRHPAQEVGRRPFQTRGRSKNPESTGSIAIRTAVSQAANTLPPYGAAIPDSDSHIPPNGALIPLNGNRNPDNGNRIPANDNPIPGNDKKFT
jgi:hypothetical protein